jgi:hypothetical protein
MYGQLGTIKELHSKVHDGGIAQGHHHGGHIFRSQVVDAKESMTKPKMTKLKPLEKRVA